MCNKHTNTQTTPQTINPTNRTPTPNINIQTTTHTITNSKQLKILQLNINGIRSKINELTLLTQQQNIDIITIQESKLTDKSNTPNIPK